MIELTNVSARAPAKLGRDVLTNLTLEHRSGVLAIIGAPADGTSLVLDVLDGSVKPTAGRVVVLGESPDAVRSRIARVSLDAPLPEALRVDEVCDLAAELRGEPRRAASERLGSIGIAMLARRKVRSLSLEERRAVTLAIALTSTAEVLLVEEPLVAIDPVAPRLVVDSLRARAATASVLVTTGSPRDATRLADRLGVLTRGAYTSLPPEMAHTSLGPERSASIRVVVSPSHARSGAAALIGLLGGVDVVTHVEASAFAARSGAVAIVVSGQDLGSLSRAVSHAIATARVDVELIEPSTLSLDAIRAALAARAMSPPPGSLPPGRVSTPPDAMPGSIPPLRSPSIPGSAPPGSVPPGSVPPGSAPPSSAPSGSAPPGSVPPGSAPSGSAPPASRRVSSLPPPSLPPPRSGGSQPPASRSPGSLPPPSLPSPPKGGRS